MTLYVLISFFALALTAGCNSNSTDDGGETTGGETTGGDTTGGDTTGGDTTGGDTTGGDTTGGDTTGGDTTGGDTTGGDTTGGDTVSGAVSLLGVVLVLEDVAENEIFATANFGRYSANIPVASINEILSRNLDTCEVEVEPADGESGLPEFNNIDLQSVSAGEVLLLSTSAGSYMQLQRQVFNASTFYRNEEENLPGPIPVPLSLNVPGDVFPAFSNVLMPPVDTLMMSAPAIGEIVTPGTTFNWSTGSNANTQVTIQTSGLNSDNQFIDVFCVAADDGAFSFPISVQALMGEEFESSSIDITRQAFSALQQGNAVLVLNTSSDSAL